MIDKNLKKFFIAKNDEKFGPYSISELLTVDIDKETLIWYNGLENWVKINEVDELSQIFNQVPPPIPKSIMDSTQKVIVESPIDITLTKKSQFTEEERIEKKRNMTKYLLSEFTFILLFFAISAFIGFMSYFLFSQINKPELVSEENQKMFNEEFSKRNQENQISMAFGDIMYKYLGSYKYDDEISSSTDLDDINRFRIGVLENKSSKLGWYIFYILLGILLVYRYLMKFVKWLYPSDNTTKLIDNKDSFDLERSNNENCLIDSDSFKNSEGDSNIKIDLKNYPNSTKLIDGSIINFSGMLKVGTRILINQSFPVDGLYRRCNSNLKYEVVDGVVVKAFYIQFFKLNLQRL